MRRRGSVTSGIHRIPFAQPSYAGQIPAVSLAFSGIHKPLGQPRRLLNGLFDLDGAPGGVGGLNRSPPLPPQSCILVSCCRSSPFRPGCFPACYAVDVMPSGPVHRLLLCLTEVEGFSPEAAMLPFYYVLLTSTCGAIAGNSLTERSELRAQPPRGAIALFRTVDCSHCCLFFPHFSVVTFVHFFHTYSYDGFFLSFFCGYIWS